MILPQDAVWIRPITLFPADSARPQVLDRPAYFLADSPAIFIWQQQQKFVPQLFKHFLESKPMPTYTIYFSSIEVHSKKTF